MISQAAKLRVSFFFFNLEGFQDTMKTEIIIPTAAIKQAWNLSLKAGHRNCKPFCSLFFYMPFFWLVGYNSGDMGWRLYLKLYTWRLLHQKHSGCVRGQEDLLLIV